MTRLNQGEVVLISVMVEGVLPRSNGPNAGKMGISPSGKPRAGSLVSELLPRSGICPWDGVINLLLQGKIARNDSDAICRIAKLEVVDGVRADGLAQAGGGNSARLDPRFVDHAERIAPPAESSGGRAKRPRIVGIFEHQSKRLAEIDIAFDIFFTPRGG